jgi:hypothetical protein
MSAPMPRSGRTMRPMGRRRICAVPLRKLTNCCPTSSPVSRRIVVPELPQSSTVVRLLQAVQPRPWTINSVGVITSICTPSPRITLIVERQSPPSRKLRTCVVAFGNAAEHDGAVADRLVAGHGAWPVS